MCVCVCVCESTINGLVTSDLFTVYKYLFVINGKHLYLGNLFPHFAICNHGYHGNVWIVFLNKNFFFGI